MNGRIANKRTCTLIAGGVSPQANQVQAAYSVPEHDTLWGLLVAALHFFLISER